jgi:hypothetical protein
LLALRMRASMSAIGSVSTLRVLGQIERQYEYDSSSRHLPRAFGHARDDALVGELAQADSAESELAEDGTRAPAPAAARVGTHPEALRPRLLDGK